MQANLTNNPVPSSLPPPFLKGLAFLILIRVGIKKTKKTNNPLNPLSLLPPFLTCLAIILILIMIGIKKANLTNNPIPQSPASFLLV
jgi:hypothetical protein